MPSRIVGIVAGALFLAPVPARAVVPEGTWGAAVGAGLAATRARGGRALGGLLSLEGHRGLTDALSLRLALAGSWHQERDGDPGPLRMGTLTVGVTYVLDVFRVVPLAEVGVAGVVRGGDGGGTRLDPGVELGLGFEYLVTRRWAAGLVARYLWTPWRASGDGRGRAAALVRVGRSF